MNNNIYKLGKVYYRLLNMLVYIENIPLENAITLLNNTSIGKQVKYKQYPELSKSEYSLMEGVLMELNYYDINKDDMDEVVDWGNRIIEAYNAVVIRKELL